MPDWMQGLNERQIQVLQFVKKEGRITRREYKKLEGIRSTVAKQDFQSLLERGLLARQGTGPATHYVIPNSSRSTRKFGDH